MNSGEIENILIEAFSSPTKPLVFFVGAGVSKDSALPDFFSFSRHIIQSLAPINFPPSESEILAKQLRPEVLIHILMGRFGNRIFDFYKWLESRNPNPNHYFLAQALRYGHHVFTTNVDNLIEQACEKLQFYPHVCISNDEFQTILTAKIFDVSTMVGPGCLCKLHGSIDSTKRGRKKYESIQFSLNQVGCGLTEAKQAVLVQALRNFDVFFMGYSGCDHFSVQPILRSTKSNNTIYWLQFDRHTSLPFVESDIRSFGAQRDLEIKKLSTKRYLEVQWELISVNEILNNRNNAHKWHGNTSDFLKKILEFAVVNFPQKRNIRRKAPLPNWLSLISDFDRCISAAILYHQARIMINAEYWCKEAMHNAVNAKQRGEAYRLLGEIHEMASTHQKYVEASKVLENAFDLFITDGVIDLAIDTKLEEANVLRRDKRYREALDILDYVQVLLQQNILRLKPNFKHWARSKLHRLYSLTLGLSGKDIKVTCPSSGSLSAIQHCDLAIEHSDEIGDISGKASTLNAKGLILHELANRNIDVLQASESALNSALELNSRIGDARACFQQCRNLGLVHSSLSHLDSANRQDWLTKAMDDYTNAEEYLKQMHEELIPGEIREVRFRRGELLLQSGALTDAEHLLDALRVEREEDDEWHEEARTLQLLLKVNHGPSKSRRRIERIIEIYTSVLQSDKRKGAYIQDGRKQTNRREILDEARTLAQKLGLKHLVDQLDKISIEFDTLI
ncbi:MAG: SIR2 family protein [Candidatus Methanoperedens sp.]